MVKIAVIQASAIPFEPQKTVAKAIEILSRVSQEGAQLAVFPEAFLGGYPKGVKFGSVVGNRSDEGRNLYQKYVEGAVEINGDEIASLIEAATTYNTIIVMGIIEKLGRTLYCTSITLEPQKGLTGFHRKLMPTGQERLIWGFGDGSTIPVTSTAVGKIGTVICWENYMPALRQAMYAQHVELYCTPTADDRPTWINSMVHIALEGRVFVISACQAIKLNEYPTEFIEQYELNANVDDYIMHGGSVVISPLGEILAGPVYDQETEIYVDLDLSILEASNLDFDVNGHYSRPDIFTLNVNSKPQKSVIFD